MTTDDGFETRLRARLADLADREDDWADPLPEARRRAAESAVEVDEVGPVAATPPARRRVLPGLAVAATLVALLVAGGFGLRALVQPSQAGSAGSSAGSAARAPNEDAGNSAAGASAAAPDAGGAVVGSDSAGCQTGGRAVSTGPLAGVATIRPSGIAQPHTRSGGSAGISYQLTFGEAGGTAQLRAARAVRTVGGLLCSTPAALTPGAIQVVPVAPGAGISGSVAFTANDSRGEPLPADSYQVVLVIPYSVDGAAMSQLVSPPVTVVVA